MSISTIDLRGKGGTYGLQVRVRRGKKKPLTKFFAFKKHGGLEKTEHLARQTEIEMKAAVALVTVARKKNEHASVPNANSTSGIAGIRAFYEVDNLRKPILQFSAFWRSGKGKKRKSNVVQRSTRTYGILGALKQALDARAAGTGQKMPTPRKAWEIIKAKLGIKRAPSGRKSK